MVQVLKGRFDDSYIWKIVCCVPRIFVFLNISVISYHCAAICMTDYLVCINNILNVLSIDSADYSMGLVFDICATDV